MFEFAQSVFNDLMCVVTFKIVKHDWENAARKVEFGDAFSLLKDRIDSVAAEIEIQELKQ